MISSLAWEERLTEASQRLSSSLAPPPHAEWMLPFSRYALHTSSVAVSLILTAILNSEETLVGAPINSVKSGLKKLSRSDFEGLLRLFLMDYLASLQFRNLLSGEEKDRLFATLKFSKREKKQGDEFLVHYETVRHSRTLLSYLRLGKAAYHEYLIDTVEEVKHEIYLLMDKRFQAFQGK